MTSKSGVFPTLLGMAFLDVTYISLTFPLITLIFFDTQSHLFPAGTSFAVRSVWFGLCVSLPNIINTVVTPALCVLSDEWGRKKILLIDIIRAMLFSLTVGVGIASGLLWLIFLGFIIKGAFARPNPTVLAVVGDIASKDKKVLYMGYLQFAISLGASLGPILGGYLAGRFLFPTLNFSLPFFVAACLAALNLLLVIFFLRETLAERRKGPLLPLGAIKQLITHPPVLQLSLLLLLIQISWSTYYQFIPPILKTTYHFDSHQLGWFIGMIAAWLALATGVGIKLLHAFLSLRQMMLLGMYLILGGLVLTLLGCLPALTGQSALLAWLAAMPTAMGDVITYSCLMALYSNLVKQEEQGKIMGISFIVASSAWTVTGLLGGLLMSFSPLLPLLLSPISLIAALMLIQTKTSASFTLSYEMR